MAQILVLVLGLLLSLSAHASGCGCSTKNTVLKEVTSRESSFITSRDGTPLKATFFAASDAAPVAAAVTAPVAPAAPIAKTENVTAFKLEFASNAKTPNATSMAQMSAIKEMLASGDYKSVKIVGFADQTGSTTYNNQLSLARAKEVQKMLTPNAPQKTALSAIGGGIKETSNLDNARVVEVQFVK